MQRGLAGLEEGRAQFGGKRGSLVNAKKAINGAGGSPCAVGALGLDEVKTSGVNQAIIGCGERAGGRAVKGYAQNAIRCETKEVGNAVQGHSDRVGAQGDGGGRRKRGGWRRRRRGADRGGRGRGEHGVVAMDGRGG